MSINENRQLILSAIPKIAWSGFGIGGFGHVALIYHQKRFINVQREIKLSGLKRSK